MFFFDKIEVNGNIDVFLIKGKRQREAKVYADSEIIESVLSKVSQKTLFIDANNTYNIARRLPFIRLVAERKYPVEVIVSIQNIEEIRLMGQSNLTAQDITSDQLTIFMASSGKLHIQNILVPKLKSYKLIDLINFLIYLVEPYLAHQKVRYLGLHGFP